MARWKRFLQDVAIASACGNSCCSSKSFFDMSVDNKKEETKAASEEKAENK